MTLRDQIASDLEPVFMNKNEFAKPASFFHSGIKTDLTLQLFEQLQDFRTPTFFRIWCSITSLPDIVENDYFLIDGVKYGVVSFVPDEAGTGLTIFANKDNTWVA